MSTVISQPIVNTSLATPVAASETARIIAEHYQKSFELTNKQVSQRNSYFLWILVVVLVGALLSWRPNDTQLIVRLALARALDVNDSQTLFSPSVLGLIHAIILAIVFYLMTNLYKYNALAARNYQYLDILEQEIRQLLNLPADSSVFTREGAFYWSMRHRGLDLMRLAYSIALGILLALLICARCFADYSLLITQRPSFLDDSLWLAIFEWTLIAMIVAYYLAYLVSSNNLDRRVKVIAASSKSPLL
ncbi:MAG: hypothetical protein U0822_08765 [Anaerolineae bacterium]